MSFKFTLNWEQAKIRKWSKVAAKSHSSAGFTVHDDVVVINKNKFRSIEPDLFAVLRASAKDLSRRIDRASNGPSVQTAVSAARARITFSADNPASGPDFCALSSLLFEALFPECGSEPHLGLVNRVRSRLPSASVRAR